MANIAAFNTYDDDAVASGTAIEEDLAKIRAVVDGAIAAVNIATGAVTAAKLASDAVTTVKIQDSAVTTDKLATGAVSTAKIADGAVTSSKLPSAGISGDRLSTASMGLGTGADGTKAGAIKGIYISHAHTAAVDTNQSLTHNLGTTQIIGIIPLQMTFGSAPGASFNPIFHTWATNGSNAINVQCNEDCTGNTVTVLFLILYY